MDEDAASAGLATAPSARPGDAGSSLPRSASLPRNASLVPDPAQRVGSKASAQSHERPRIDGVHMAPSRASGTGSAAVVAPTATPRIGLASQQTVTKPVFASDSGLQMPLTAAVDPLPARLELQKSLFRSPPSVLVSHWQSDIILLYMSETYFRRSIVRRLGATVTRLLVSVPAPTFLLSRKARTPSRTAAAVGSAGLLRPAPGLPAARRLGSVHRASPSPQTLPVVPAMSVKLPLAVTSHPSLGILILPVPVTVLRRARTQTSTLALAGPARRLRRT